MPPKLRNSTLALLVLLGPAARADEQAVPPETGRVVVLQTLDKVTGRLGEMEAATGAPVRFGTLAITAMTCTKASPEETPEVSAFLVIDDLGHDEASIQVFSGWMFASSPGLSALEHPVYDVWVKDCRIVAPSTEAGKR